MFTAVLSGFMLCLAAPLLYRILGRATGWVIALFPFGLFLYFANSIGSIAPGQVRSVSYPWLPSLGINLSFYLDGLSLLFALLICGIGALVVLYAGTYLAGHPQLGRFYTYIMMFMASMLGLVLADNMIALFVFWELTSLSSYLLIGFDHEREAARAGALQALLITGIGGLALLVGLLLLGQAGGTIEISDLLNQGEYIRSHALYLPILFLVLAGAFTKSAQFPFHFWLPSAMEAPTPVSTYLHSATMVKAGVYLLARFSPVIGGTDLWRMVVIIVGATTMLLGAFQALQPKDLKRILAYSTVSILGALFLLLGIGTRVAIEATLAYVLIHCFYKAALFLVVGTVDHETGTRDVGQLSGLRHAMPVTAIASGLAALSMAGLPPLFGFIGKELIYTATLGAPLAASILTGASLMTNVLMVVVAGIVGFQPFIGEKMANSKRFHEAPIGLWLGPLILAAIGAVMGLLSGPVGGTFFSPAVSAVLLEPLIVDLGLMHGFTVQLLLSGITFAFGVILYIKRDALRGAILRLNSLIGWGPERGYTLALKSLNAVARFQTRLLQNGHLHIYVLIIIITTVGLTGITLLHQRALIGIQGWADIRIYEWIVAAIILAATIVTVRAHSRLVALVALGVVGNSVVLIFVMFGAPDLAMTQFSIDALTVILLALILYRLPRYVKYSSTNDRIRDAVPALAAGGLITALILATTATPMQSRLSPYFSDNSYLRAQGRNIVNVILVDFRALDTLGEITVLAVAAIGVYSLLKLRTER